MSAPSILLRMDGDSAGQGAVEQISNLSQSVTCIQVSHGKDLNDINIEKGFESVLTWIMELNRSVVVSSMCDNGLSNIDPENAEKNFQPRF